MSQHFDRDLAVVLQVFGEIDRGHAAAPNLALQGVAGCQGFLQTLDVIGRGSPLTSQFASTSATQMSLCRSLMEKKKRVSSTSKLTRKEGRERSSKRRIRRGRPPASS